MRSPVPPRRCPSLGRPLTFFVISLAVLAPFAAGCGAASQSGPAASAPTVMLDPTAPPEPSGGKGAFPFRLPCGDDDLLACTNGCNDRQIEDCVTLASMYLAGRSVAPDKNRAIELLKAACDDSSARGCMRLGDAYHAGVLTGDADETACYRKACDAGANQGCVEAGKAYLAGRGVDVDAKLAALLFTKVCDRGNATGCFELGRLFESGEGVTKSDERSFALYSKACNLGLDQACLAAGRTEEITPPRN